MKTYTEREKRLLNIATFDNCDVKSKKALEILRKYFNSTYHYCCEWDYAVISTACQEAVGICDCFTPETTFRN